jgi:preprotein translocase subunit SecD
VAEPATLADLAAVSQRAAGRLAFYDWGADALTPDGQPVSDGLRRHGATAVLISQGSGTEPPGTGAGSVSRHDAVRLASRQRPRAGAVVRAWAPISGASADAPQYYVLRDRPALSRADITEAYAESDPLGHPDIVLSFTPQGMRRLHDLTAEVARRGATVSSPSLSLNQHIAAVVDGRLLSVLYVDFRAHPDGISPVDGAQITGGFSPTAAQQIATEIEAPPLPAELELVDSTTFTRRQS